MTACCGNRPVRTEVVTKVVDKYRPLPEELTEAVADPAVPAQQMIWADVAELALKWRKVAAERGAKLAKIRSLEGRQ